MSPWLPTGAIAAVLLLAPACAQTAPTTGYELHDIDISGHLARVGLGPEDVFEVRVYGEKQLSGTYRVSPNGEIDFPFVGRLDVRGMTPENLSQELRHRLLDGYLVDPQVTVYVKEYNSKKIFVLGEVQKPGTFPFTNAMNVVEAITLAGGFKDSANENYVVVTRKKDGKETRIPVPVEKISKGLAANLMLQAGDIIFVPDRLL